MHKIDRTNAKIIFISWSFGRVRICNGHLFDLLACVLGAFKV